MIDVRARGNSSARNGFRFALKAAATLLTLLFVASCGGDIFLVGTPVITLTAQRGHFTSYIITIDEIELTRRDGTVIELPTVSERMDLANLGNFVQLLEAPAAGIGTYVSATFFVDYSAPYITVDNDGEIGSTTLTDAYTGTTPTVDAITVKFDPNNPLVITNQGSSLVNFNIDLDASNTIDYNSVDPSTVYVHPAITVTANPIYTQPVFARGLFVYVGNDNGYFVMNSRPLHDVLDNPFGAVTVVPSATTYYNIDGETYVGAAGLAKLKTMQSETDLLQIAAIGTGTGTPAPWSDLSGITPQFQAQQVYAGTSLESTVQDHIVGWVTGIASGNTTTGGFNPITPQYTTGLLTLNIQNAALVDRLGEYGFQNTTPVVVATTTIVSEDGVATATAPGLPQISVGQLIDVSGQVGVDASNNPVGLDATAGQVRLQPTTLWGTLVSGTSSTATVNLQWIQDIAPLYTDFAGTGTSSSVDASAANYVVNTASTTGGATDESATAAGTLLQIVGLANTFGAGPPYFNATSVTAASTLPQRLVLEFTEPGGAPEPFSTISASGLFVYLADADLVPSGLNHLVEVGPQTVDVTAQASPYLDIIPSLVPGSSFSIGNTANGWAAFTDPNEFAAEVQYYTETIGNVQKIIADGQYDAAAGTFTATNIEIVIQK